MAFKVAVESKYSAALTLHARMASASPLREVLHFGEGGKERPGDPDWLIVIEDLAEPFRCNTPKERRVLVAAEPSAIRSYRVGFLRQFGTIVSVQRKHENYAQEWIGEPSWPWRFGARIVPGSVDLLLGASALRNFDASKEKLVSMISSDKCITRNHYFRMGLALELKRRLAEKIDIYGHASTSSQDKTQTIGPYRYSIVCENSYETRFFSEKLLDAYLGLAFPLYCGANPSAEYLCNAPLHNLSGHSIRKAAEAVERIITINPSPPLQALAATRSRILESSGIWGGRLASHVLSSIQEQARDAIDSQAEETLVWPESNFRRTLPVYYSALRHRAIAVYGSRRQEKFRHIDEVQATS